MPDVAGDADPFTGYTIRVDGKSMVIGGTSAVAPLWAGLIAARQRPERQDQPAFIQPAIYAAKGKAAFNDITSGTNYSGTPVGFKAGPGWDACTGLGSPIGTKLIAGVKPTSPSKTTKKAKKKSAKKSPPMKKKSG